ncbi:MAG: endonuclease [Arcobacteraceae bacterium]|nr:endonuclease [Arcobacteraceae bacterium]
MKNFIFRIVLLSSIVTLSNIYALNFKVATYNVENLFDLNNDGTEYEEYIPDNTNWNKETLEVKLTNISKVINDLNVDILALEEIESQTALDLLLAHIPQYKYNAFVKNPKSAIGIAVISKYEISNVNTIEVDAKNPHSRPILEVDIKVEDKTIKVFANHWRSKNASESARIPYAKALYTRIKKLPCETDYIILGDFNSNYNEYDTFKYNRILNDTNGIAGINDILKTTINSTFITKDNLYECDDYVHYNLWLETPSYKRFSYRFRGSYETPDSIIISTSLLDGHMIDYVDSSFSVFMPYYLYQKEFIQRWKIDKKGFHKRQGYSDHLPIYATFSTTPKKLDNTKKLDLSKISSLYEIESILTPLTIKDAVVLYKTADSAIIKQDNDRAIFIYNAAKELETGKRYDLTVNKISLFYGQKQITEINNITQKGTETNYQKYFLQGSGTDFSDFQLQNEIITDISGYFVKKELRIGNKSIRLYAKNKNVLPPQKSNIRIKTAHISIYNNTPQLIIYSKDDYEVISIDK